MFSCWQLTINTQQESVTTPPPLYNLHRNIDTLTSPWSYSGCFIPIDEIWLNDSMVATVDIYRRLFRITTLSQRDSIAERLVKTWLLFAYNLHTTHYSSDFLNPVKRSKNPEISLVYLWWVLTRSVPLTLIIGVDTAGFIFIQIISPRQSQNHLNNNKME